MKLYVPLLKSCATLISVQQIHAQLITAGLHGDALLATKLIESYAKMNNTEAARLVFGRFYSPDSFMLGVMIKSYVWNFQFREAISMYNHGLQQHREFWLSSFVLTPVLQACTGLCDLAMGRKVHGRIIKSSLDSDVVVETALVQMHAEGGSLEDARRVFDEMPERDVVSWSLMISCYVRCGEAGRGLRLFSEMNKENVECDSVVMLTVAEACGIVGLLREAKSVHGHILRKWTKPDELIENSLITMYGDCRNIDSAEKVFRKAPMRSTISWTAMIAAYNRGSSYREALCIYTEMLKAKVEPNLVTIMDALFSCARLELLKEGKSVHGFSLRRGIDPYLNSLGSALISMYSSFGHIAVCLSVFGSIDKKTIILFNSLIAACAQAGASEKALELFGQMRSEGLLPDSFTLASALPACGHICEVSTGKQIHGIVIKSGSTANKFVQNSLIDMYCKSGSTDIAFQVFDEITHKNVVSWNALVSGLSDRNSSSGIAIELFEKMHHEGVGMDAVTYLGAIKACTSLGSLAKGKWIHHKLITSGMMNETRITASLTNLYAKCGDIEMARAVFDSVTEKSVVLWSSIISGYASHGRVAEALELFDVMLRSGMKPNAVTFMAILSACCHSGRVEEGLTYFNLMRDKFNIEPELDHCISVVDLLSRAGQIELACSFIESMRVELNSSVWRALLHGCYVHRRDTMVSVIQQRIL